MRWVRNYRQFGGWLALAALALQLVLSFGHIHFARLHHAAAPVAVAGAGGQGTQGAPAPHPGNDADDYCAICATIYLTATSFVPQPPQLPAPFASQPVEHRFAVVFPADESTRVAFRSRAPPLS